MTPSVHKRLRIAVWHNLPSGGGKRALYDHVSGLLKRGHEVTAWCPPSADQNYLPLSALCSEHVLPLSDAAAPSLLRWQQPWHPYRLLRARLAAMDEHCRLCAEAIQAGGFDIVFANACRFFRMTPIARHVRIPNCMYLGEPYRALYEALPNQPWAALPRPPGSRWTPRAIWRAGRDLVAKQGQSLQVREEVQSALAFDRILVNSLFSRESVLRAYGMDSKVCYLGVDLQRFRPTGEKKQGFVLGLGGLSVSKGPDRAIRALAAIEPRQRPRFVWVGNFAHERYRNEIECLAKSLDVLLEVKVHIPDPELISLLSRASVLLYTPRLEPFGLAPLEANACATTVVGIAEGGVRESVVHGINGLLVQDDDPLRLGQLVAGIVSSPQRAEEMGQRALAHVQQQWGVEHGIDRLAEHLVEIIENRRQPARSLKA